MGLIRPGALLAVTLLAGCREDGLPAGMSLSFGSYAASPVVLLEARVNGQPVEWPGYLVAGMADSTTPRGSGISLLDYVPAENPREVHVAMTWIEVMTSRAWRAEVVAPLSAFARAPGTGSVEVTPIFGPNGLMIVASDPVPTSATDIPLVDVARLCGKRVPALDADLLARPADTVNLQTILDLGVPPVTGAECPAAE